MLKKITCFILAAILIACSIPALASDNGPDWKTLYRAKMDEIIQDYENGTKSKGDTIDGFNDPYFSIQDINFDGVPELYHALIGMFELDPSVSGNEEIYYIKDGRVVQGKIDSKVELCLLPCYAGNKANPGDMTTDRWQYAMQDRQTGEVCFITNNSYGYGADFTNVTYSKLYFDATSGILKSEVLLYREEVYYTDPPVYLDGYDYVAADCYTSLSEGYWNLYNWTPGYLAPSVIVNNQKLIFDVQPQIINNRTMVPLRTIFEALGADVQWDGTSNTVTAVKGGTTIKMTIGADHFTKNGEIIALDSPAVIIASRTLVPARAIAEAFGLVVNWNGSTKTVTISEDATQKSEIVINGETAKSIIEGRATFVDFETKQSATVHTLPKVNSSFLGTASRYTIIDLDNNGSNELLIEYNLAGDTAIITVKNGSLVAYYVPYRGIIGLKTDGTSLSSWGAESSALCKISEFSDEGIVWEDIVVDDGPVHEIHGVSASEDEVNKMFKDYFAKADVAWTSIN